jgi:hypothetical protein
VRPLFTLHAGEVVVGQHIEHNYTNLEVWVPTKDTGVDFLVTNKDNKKALSLQVKLSKDHFASLKNAEISKQTRAYGWLTLNRKKIDESTADYWIIVLLGFNGNSKDFIIIKPKELLKRLEGTPGRKNGLVDTFIWVTDTETKTCWEARGLKNKEKLLVLQGRYNDKTKRDFKGNFNNWSPIEKLNCAVKQSVRSSPSK